MEEQIAGLIVQYELDFLRLDDNSGYIGPGAQATRHEFVESSYWRYYETLYGICSRLRQRFPRVVFENCASGGARSDVGIMRFFDHTWGSDHQGAPQSFAIANGMTMALPPDRIDRIGAGGLCGCFRAAELDFQTRLTLFAHPPFGYTHATGSRPNPLQLARLRHTVELYKAFVRPFHRSSRIYHRTPVVEGLDPHGWGVLELASRDRQRAVAGLFRLSDTGTGQAARGGTAGGGRIGRQGSSSAPAPGRPRSLTMRSPMLPGP